MCEPKGPMEKGTTYMVRPCMQPSNKGFKVWRISAGAIQLLVGPAFSFFSEQMYVRSSTRATSEGSEQAKKLPGRLAGLSFLKVPLSTNCWHRRSYSSSEPSHQYTLAGLHKAAISATQAISLGFLTYVGVFRFKPCITGEFMGKAPKFKNRFLQWPSGLPARCRKNDTCKKRPTYPIKGVCAGFEKMGFVPVL